ncbi:uncharacterized protein AUP68_10068 [Ilyonectria robusta]
MDQRTPQLSGTAGSSHYGDNVMHRQRRFATKARTGCITCKIRKIKCDEAKPSCQRCTSTGRKCDGYVTAMPKAQLASLLPSGGNHAERQALYMFRTKIAISIASVVDAGFWTYDLLQTAEAYQTVQHAVAALATAYHASILSSHGDQMERQFILTQYNKSINSLYQCLSTPKPLTRDQKVVILMTNLVFICICAVQGFHREACMHLQSGLSLLHEWQLVAEGTDGSDTTPTPVQLLATVYTQLDTQARIIIKASTPHQKATWRPHTVALDGWGRGRLRAVTKAVSQLENLHNKSIQITALPGPVESDFHARHRSQLMEEHRKQLLTWDLDFGWLIGQESNSIKALRMRRLLAGANLEAGLSRAGNASECDQTWASETLKLANEIVQNSRLSEAVVAFSPAGGLVEALYFVATACPDDGIKTKCIDLLEEYPIIEGLWSSCAAYAALNKKGRVLA